MKHLNQYKTESFNSKSLPSYITEYIIKKKLDKPINSEDHYEYSPKTKDDLIKVIHMLLDKGETNFNCIDTSAITDMSLVFGEMLKIQDKDFDVSEWDVSNVTNMEGLFANCVKFNCDLSKWDVSNVENMYSMLTACENFKGKGIENWKVSNVENMVGMFYSCKKLNCDLSKWDVSKVKNKRSMFYDCNSLKNIPSWKS